ncbi:homocysteine biosynthesis protein [candidate division WOR-3 bacterium]|nr:homocysteine biosynthesis protein [candidate division WOR-3 bacterium]
MKKSFEEIKEKIKAGKGVVLTAEEFKELAREKTPKELAEKVDVVTTATFSPMCSSGAFLNFKNCRPPIRMEEIYLNGVRAHAGIAAADAYVGATQISEENPEYGGANVIHSLVKGEKILLEAKAKGTDCYPKKNLKVLVDKSGINEAFLFNPRNAYQNYAAAVNTSEKDLQTYMGILVRNCGNINFCTAGEISPLINDPFLEAIGIGTKIFLCGAQGFVCWNGTQHDTCPKRNNRGIPLKNAASISVIGDLKKMDRNFISPVYFKGYGLSLYVGIGIPIPIIDENAAFYAAVRNSEIDVPLVDFSSEEKKVLKYFKYEELLSGKAEIKGKKVKTNLISGLRKSKKISCLLKMNILSGDFIITELSSRLPEAGKTKSLVLKSDKRKVKKSERKVLPSRKMEESCPV